MQKNTLSRKTKRMKAVQVGRGGTRGKTSGRGTKGQNARAGRKKRPEERDIIKRLPKKRGYGKNRAKSTVGSREKAVAVSVKRLAAFKDGEIVTLNILASRGIIESRNGKLPLVKIVGQGEVPKVSVKGIALSASAKESVLSAGGTVKS